MTAPEQPQQQVQQQSESTSTVPAFLKEDKPEMVDHPAHYGGDKPYEVVKVLEAWLTPEQFIGFLRGNSLKYQARAGKKADEDEDLKKARWYQEYELKFRERMQAAEKKK